MSKVTNYDFNCDMSKVVLWQYDDAKRLKEIIANEQKFMDSDVSGFYEDFNKDVLDIATANTFGLSVWGQLLAVPRPSYTVPLETKEYYGFYQESNDPSVIYTEKDFPSLGFGDKVYVYTDGQMVAQENTISWKNQSVQQIDYVGHTGSGRYVRDTTRDMTITITEGTQSFTDDQYRLLLRARIYLLTFDGSARALNEFFHVLFPNAIFEIKDNLDMSVSITAVSGLDDEYKILFQAPYSDMFIPRPSGVEYTTNLTPTDYTKVFGFEGQTNNGVQLPGFDNGTFIQG